MNGTKNKKRRQKKWREKNTEMIKRVETDTQNRRTTTKGNREKMKGKRNRKRSKKARMKKEDAQMIKRVRNRYRKQKKEVERG